MTTARQYAADAAVALYGVLRISPTNYDSDRVTDVIERTVINAALDREQVERKRLEEVREAEQERLLRLLNASPSVIYSFKASGDYAPTFVSKNLKRVFGYDQSEYLDNPDFWRDRVHPDDLSRVEAEIARLFGNGFHALEYRFRRKDGSYCWVNDEQHLIRGENGEPLEIVGSWSDVTARKAAEEAKAAAHARLSQLLTAAPAVIYSFKASGDYAPTFISDNIERLLGYKPSEYLENPDFWRDRVHPDDLGRVTAEFSRIFDSGYHAYEYRFLRSDGTYCWVNDQLHLIRDTSGNPIEIVGSWSDISARKLAEEAQHESERRLVDAIESIGEGFAFYDADDRLALCNTRYREMLHADGIDEIAVGTAFESIVRNAVATGRVSEAGPIHAEQWIEDRLARHRNPGSPTIQHRSDGRWIQVSERRVGGGGTVAVYSDITELKENEERVAKAHRLILESLRYASRIQSAMLPGRHALAAATRDYFLTWEPRDIVGGDFFWFHRTDLGYFIIVGDCTGHGVPGAFMTLIACGLLDRHLRSLEIQSPGLLLSRLHRDLQMLLGQDQGHEGETDDGFESGICFVSDIEQRLVFAGAHFSLWQAHGGTLNEIKGDRAGIGFRRCPADMRFNNVTVDLVEGDTFYMTTDGLIEQIGATQGHSFGRKRFVEVLTQCNGRTLKEQQRALMGALGRHQGQERRRDDVTVLGFVPYVK
jgi:PAS domain S-box-containing protein